MSSPHSTTSSYLLQATSRELLDASATICADRPGHGNVRAQRLLHVAFRCLDVLSFSYHFRNLRVALIVSLQFAFAFLPISTPRRGLRLLWRLCPTSRGRKWTQLCEDLLDFAPDSSDQCSQPQNITGEWTILQLILVGWKKVFSQSPQKCLRATWTVPRQRCRHGPVVFDPGPGPLSPLEPSPATPLPLRPGLPTLPQGQYS